MTKVSEAAAVVVEFVCNMIEF
jgi:dynein heavy chain